MKHKILFVFSIIFLFVHSVAVAWQVPTLSSPSSGSNVWTGVTLDWNSVPNSQFYQLQVDTTLFFVSPNVLTVSKVYINSNSSNSDTQHYLEDLYFGKTYYWRVRAYVTNDTSSWSAPRTFITNNYVTLSSPSSGSNTWTGLTLDWDSHTGVDFYDIQVDTNLFFNSGYLKSSTKIYINSSSGNSDTQHYLEDLMFGKVHYWRVRARNAVDTSEWSTVRAFTTNDYVTLSSPSSGQTNVNVSGTTLDWNSHTGVKLYQLEIDTINLFSSPYLKKTDKVYINSSSGNSDTQYITGALITNKIFYWRVRAINNSDTSAWTTWVFSTGTCSPPMQPLVINGQSNVCAGSVQNYNIAPVSGATSYVWDLPLGWSGTSNSSSILTTIGANNGVITVIAVNSCGSSIIQKLGVNISGSLPLQPVSIFGPSSTCKVSSYTYSISPVLSAISYEWTLPSGWIGSSTKDSISVITGFSGGNISVKSKNGCGTSFAQVLPVTTTTINNVVNQSGFTLTASALGVSYQWFNCDNNQLIVGADSQRFTPTFNGRYGVVLKQNGCVDTSICKTITGVSIVNVNNFREFILYPNPTKGTLYLNSELLLIENLKVSIFSILGEKINSFYLNENTGNEIDVSNLSSGLYIVTLKSNLNSYYVKLIKE